MVGMPKCLLTAFTAALLLAPPALHAASVAPQIIWASDPVRPDETVVVIGEALGPGCQVELGPLADGPITRPPTNAARVVKRWETIRPIQTGERSLKFVVPKSWPQGAWACRVRRDVAVSDRIILNAPAPWWWNGDGGESASPGGWLRVFGKSLNFGGQSRAVLQAADGKALTLSASASDCYALTFPLPPDVAAGDYTMSIHNDLGGDATWQSAGTVTLRPSPARKADVFNVKDFAGKAADPLLAALAKAKANGGGIVFLPRGHYAVKSTLAIPPNTVLRGEGMDLVSLYWPDFEAPPAELISGRAYGLESLSLYCQNHRNVVTDTRDSHDVALRHVRIRANCYIMIERADQEFRKWRGPASHTECGTPRSVSRLRPASREFFCGRIATKTWRDPKSTVDEAPAHARQDPGGVQAVSAHTALGRLDEVEDIAGVAIWLASEDSGWVTGQYIEASGGIGMV